jgi:hypothetical protein
MRDLHRADRLLLPEEARARQIADLFELEQSIKK